LISIPDVPPARLRDNNVFDNPAQSTTITGFSDSGNMEVLHLVFLKRFDRSEAMERLERLELVRFWSEAYGCEFAQDNEALRLENTNC
jgi:hypothetical protein